MNFFASGFDDESGATSILYIFNDNPFDCNNFNAPVNPSNVPRHSPFIYPSDSCFRATCDELFCATS